MKRVLICLIGLISTEWAIAQFENYNNLELALGYKPYNANTSQFIYNYTTTDTNVVNYLNGKFHFTPFDRPFQLQAGTDLFVSNNFLIVAHGWFMLPDRFSWGASIGAAYRIKANYFIHLQPELRFFMGQVSTAFGNINYSGVKLTFDDVKYLEDTEISARYRNTNLSLQPAFKMIADISRRLEFRVSAVYNIGLLNSEGVVIKGEISPGQPVKKFISFKEETGNIQETDGTVPDKPIIRFNGVSLKFGFGFKFMW